MELDWTSLLQNYGYLAIFIGTILEGETVLLLGSFAAHQNILNIWLLIFTATAGAFIGDQFYYQVGSKVGHNFINNRPQLADKFHKASTFVEKYPTITILCMRFAWGLRTIIPISFGIKKYNYLYYFITNLIASFIWAIVIVFIGVQIIHWIHQVWDNILHTHLHLIILTTLALTIIIITYKFVFLKKNKPSV